MPSKAARKIKLSSSRTQWVWALAAVGIGTGALVLVASFWSLASIRSDRVASDRLRRKVTEIAGQSDYLVEQLGRSSERLLRGDVPRDFDTESRGPNELLSETLDSLAVDASRNAGEQQTATGMRHAIDESAIRRLVTQSQQIDPRLSNAIHSVVEQVKRVYEVKTSCQELAGEREHRDALRREAISRSMQALDQLESAVSSEEGVALLDLAREVRQFRELSGEAAREAAFQFMQTWSPVTTHADEYRELSELELLHEKLIVETNPDTLVDMRDNKIKPRLSRLRRIVDSQAEVSGHASKKMKQLDEFEEALFGVGFEYNHQRQSIVLGENGVYQACVNWLDVQKRQTAMEDTKSEAMKAYFDAKERLLQQVAAVTSDSAEHAAALVDKAYNSLLVVGVVSVIIFLILARNVAETISIQFNRLKQQSEQLALAHSELSSQKQTLDSVLESASSGIASFDEMGNILCHNPAAEEIFGIGCRGLLESTDGKQKCEFLDPVTKEAIPEDYLPTLRTLHGERVQDCELLVRRDDRDFVVSLNGKAFTRDDIASAVFCVSDITAQWERKFNQLRLRQSLDTSKDTMVIVDSEGRIIDLNSACCENLLYSRSELIGKPITEIDTLFGKRPWGEFWNSLREAKTMAFESWHRRKDGTEFPIEASTNFGSFRGTEFACAFARDISDRREAEQEREVLSNELQRAARRAGMAELAGEVLHNVGNALNSINVSIQMLRDRLDTSTCEYLGRLSEMIEDQQSNLAEFFTNDHRGKEFPRFMKQLASSASQDRDAQLDDLAGLLEQIEQVNDIVASQQSFSQHRSVKELVSPSAVIEEAIRMNVASLKRHGVRLTRDFESGEDVFIEKHSVVQVLVSLLRNAKESVGSAGIVDPTISLFLERDDEQIVFRVTDNGVGIPESNLVEIFRYGFTTKAAGTGSGLHTSANLAQELGGALTAESDGEGTGATFALSIPMSCLMPNSV